MKLQNTLVDHRFDASPWRRTPGRDEVRVLRRVKMSEILSLIHTKMKIQTNIDIESDRDAPFFSSNHAVRHVRTPWMLLVRRLSAARLEPPS